MPIKCFKRCHKWFSHLSHSGEKFILTRLKYYPKFFRDNVNDIVKESELTELSVSFVFLFQKVIFSHEL